MSDETKLNDVYRFRYNEDKDSRGIDRYWCFDGQLVVTKWGDSLRLVDTYWGDSGSARTFTEQEARKQGTLELICNMDDVEQIRDYEAHYFDEKDIFDLSHQHGCYKRFYRRKDAKRSRESMQKHLSAEMAKARNEVNSAVNRVDFLARKWQQLESATDLDAVHL